MLDDNWLDRKMYALSIGYIEIGRHPCGDKMWWQVKIFAPDGTWVMSRKRNLLIENKKQISDRCWQVAFPQLPEARKTCITGSRFLHW